MKNVLIPAGVAAACGACCALPLALPMLGSLTASSLGFAFGWIAAALAGFFTLAAMILLARGRRGRRRDQQGGMPPLHVRSNVAQGQGSCHMTAPVACPLPWPEMPQHVAATANFARRGLLAHRQCGATLYLRYSSAVARELESLVALERKYSPFLDFELARHVDAVHLIITAPAAAAEFAPILTRHFLGKPTQQSVCTPSCGCEPKAIV